MKRYTCATLVNVCIILLLIAGNHSCSPKAGNGPLRVSEENPRYFTDGSGKAVFLAGAHTWNNLIDMGPSDPPPQFDYGKYLDWMQKYNHNFFRLWTWELVNWDTRGNNENRLITVAPLAWKRSGPDSALDGKPKFDLTEYNPEFFQRLRNRVRMAQERGMYPSIMLFEGWGMQFSPNAWKNHPFHPDNNINGINGDLDGDGNGLEIYVLSDPQITALQEAYVRSVIDAVNEFDNVLYEISNENHPPSTEWQYHMINFIHQYEKSKPKQHPVGMTFQYKGGSNQALFDSPADWISPNPDGGYRDDPPASDGRKVIINDTDHLWGIGGNRAWAWKSFMRGMYILFMDPYDGEILGKPFDPQWEPVRQNLGYIRRLADRVNLLKMTPRNELASTAYCLADAGKEYIVYAPEGREVTVKLSEATGTFAVEWFNPNSDETKMGGNIEGGADVVFVSQFGSDDAVLYLKAVEL